MRHGRTDQGLSGPGRRNVVEGIGVNKKTVLALAAFVGMAIGLIWAGSMSYVDIAIILIVVLLLHLLIPASYNGHFGMFETVFIGGYLLALLADKMFAGIPAWAAWTLLALPLTATLFLLVPDFTRNNKS